MALGPAPAGARAGPRWGESLLRPALLAAMAVCLALPAVQLLQVLFAPWDGLHFLAVLFLGSLEGILSERLLRRQRIAGWEYATSRGAEALVLLLVLKLAGTLPHGWAQLQASLLRWPPAPQRLFSAVDGAAGVLFLLLWLGSIEVARLAAELDEDAGRGPPPADRTSTAYYLWLTGAAQARDRQPVLDRLAGQFLLGGVLAVLTTAVLHARGVRSGAWVAASYAVVAYFALGIGLLSQARFAVARAAWQARSVPVQERIGRRWLGWAVLFVAGAALLGRLLPAGYVDGPLDAALGALLFLLSGLLFVVRFIFFLLLWPLSLLSPGKSRPTPPAPPALPAGTPEPVGSLAAPSGLMTLFWSALWLIAAAVVVLALARFIRDRRRAGAGGEAAGEPQPGALERLRAWLRALWRRGRGWQGQAGGTLGRVLARRAPAPPPAAPAPRFLALRRLPPRELVRYFYLSTARRAAQAGQPRRPGQTPYEYRAELERRFPDLEPDLAGLTDAFIQARYSPQPVGPAEADAARPLWERLRAALRQRNRLRPG